MKKYLFGLIAVAFAVAFSAFTTSSTLNYYKFDGTTIADLDQPLSWSAGQGGEECGDAGTVCFVTSAATDITAFRSLITTYAPQSVQAVEDIPNVAVQSQKAEE